MRKTVVITGASSGIGKALAQALADKGCHLGLTGRRDDVLASLQAELLERAKSANRIDQRIEIAAVDIDELDSVGTNLHGLFERLGRIDTVVINAGINRFTKVGAGHFSDETAIIHTNLLGAMATANAAVEHFCQRGGGHLVGISSLASLQPIPSQAAYCASKAGFSMYLEALRIEHRENNIQVTQIRPGFVKTDIMDNIEKYPFAISADAAANEMVKAIDSKRADVLVPARPWRYLRPLFGHLPNSVWKRLAK